MLRSKGFAPALALALALIGCGSVQNSLPDAPPGSADARADGGGGPDAPPDASPPDAMPVAMLFDSALTFPSPSSTVTAFTAADLAAFNLTAMNVNGGASTSIVGNADAPISSAIFVHGSPMTRPTFNFASPITSVGISVYDADYGNDNAVIVRIAALDGDGAELVAHQRILGAANAASEQNLGAVFVGFSYSVPFSQVQITIDQANSTGFDNLRFR